MDAPNTFRDVMAERGYDAAFWADAVRRYWYDNTGLAEADWLDGEAGAVFARVLCWEFSDCGGRGDIHEMFDEALRSAFPDE